MVSSVIPARLGAFASEWEDTESILAETVTSLASAVQELEGPEGRTVRALQARYRDLIPTAQDAAEWTGATTAAIRLVSRIIEATHTFICDFLGTLSRYADELFHFSSNPFEKAADIKRFAETAHEFVQAGGNDGSLHWVVSLPSTQAWELSGPAGAMNDRDNNVSLMLDNPLLRTQYERMVRDAMQHAGVPQGADVVLTGFSQGGIMAANLAADGVLRHRGLSTSRLTTVRLLTGSSSTRRPSSDALQTGVVRRGLPRAAVPSS